MPKNSTYDRIVEMLMSKQLKQGDSVPEGKLAEQLGVSRTPVREALRRLAGEGIIRIYPNHQAEVISIDENYATQLGIMRIAIDKMAIRFAAYYGSTADFQKLLKRAETCMELYKSKKSSRMERSESDTIFHKELVDLSKNEFLIKYQKSLTLQVNLLQTWKYFDDKLDRGYKSSLYHIQIVECMLNRDVKGAIRTSVEHLVKFYDLEDKFDTDFFLD